MVIALRNFQDLSMPCRRGGRNVGDINKLSVQGSAFWVENKSQTQDKLNRLHPPDGFGAARGTFWYRLFAAWLAPNPP